MSQWKKKDSEILTIFELLDFFEKLQKFQLVYILKKILNYKNYEKINLSDLYNFNCTTKPQVNLMHFNRWNSS